MSGSHPRIVLTKPLELSVSLRRRPNPHDKDPRPGLISANVISEAAEGPIRGRNLLVCKRYRVAKRAKRKVEKLLAELFGDAVVIRWTGDAMKELEETADAV